MPVLSKRKLYTPQHAALYISTPAAPAGAIWDSGSATGVAISGGGAIATATAGGSAQARSTTSKSSGKWYVKVQMTSHAGGGANTGIGVIGSSFALGSIYLGGDSNSICGYTTTVSGFSGNTYYNNGSVGDWSDLDTPPGFFLELAIDQDNRKTWWRGLDSGGTEIDGWNANNIAHDPATNLGGRSISTLDPAVYFAVDFEAGETGSVWTIVSGTPPTGFTEWS